MFEEYMIQTDSLENVREGEEVTGFRFRIRLASDRGLWLSLIGGFYVAVDDAVFPQEALTLSIIGGPTHPVSELKACATQRWDYTKPAWLCVEHPGGLTAGTHKIDFEEVLLGGYFKAKEEWVNNPPTPGASGNFTTFYCTINEEGEDR